jgi:hypothetical protein
MKKVNLSKSLVSPTGEIVNDCVSSIVAGVLEYAQTGKDSRRDIAWAKEIKKEKCISLVDFDFDYLKNLILLSPSFVNWAKEQALECFDEADELNELTEK